MLNIIVYDDNKLSMQENINTINMALANYDVDYRIHKFMNCNKKLLDIIKNDTNKKIYILKISKDNTSGMEMAYMIRENDFDSIIIFVNSFSKYQRDVFYNRLMVLDFICENNVEDRLKEDIIFSLKLIYKDNIFTFKYNRIIYRIPYSHINYIEKEPLIKRCIVHTINNNYYVVDSIERLVKKLDVGFVRSHQSCIINVNNVKMIDSNLNKIIFMNDNETSLITEKFKKKLKDIFDL